MSLKPKRPVAIAVATTIEDSSEDEIHDCQGSSPAKRICVSPTWQCMHEEPTLVPELNRDECPDLATMTVGTKTVQTGMPFFFSIQPNCPPPVEEQVLVKILHSQGFWTAAFVIPNMWPIKVIMQCVLPHAIQEHFDHIEVNGAKAWFGSTPVGEGQLNILFRPFCFARNGCNAFHGIGIGP